MIQRCLIFMSPCLVVFLFYFYFSCSHGFTSSAQLCIPFARQTGPSRGLKVLSHSTCDKRLTQITQSFTHQIGANHCLCMLTVTGVSSRTCLLPGFILAGSENAYSAIPASKTRVALTPMPTKKCVSFQRRRYQKRFT